MTAITLLFKDLSDGLFYLKEKGRTEVGKTRTVVYSLSSRILNRLRHYQDINENMIMVHQSFQSPEKFEYVYS